MLGRFLPTAAAALLLLRGARAVPLVGQEAVLLQTRSARSPKLVVAEADALTAWGRPVFVQEVQLLSAGKNSSQEAVLLQTRFARSTKLVVADAGNLTAWGGPVPVQEVQLLSTGKNSSQENRSVETPGLQHSSPASLNKHMLEAQSDLPRSVRPASSWMFVLLLVAVVIFVVVRLTIRGSGGAQSGTNQKESAEREAEGVNEKVKADATEKAKTGTSEKESESERAAEREESKTAKEGEIKLSEEMRRRLREIFDACDVDGNGTINKRELIKTLRSQPGVAEFLGLPEVIRQEDGTRTEFELWFQGCDANGDREISWEEFVRAFKNSSLKSSGPRLAKKPTQLPACTV